jgi:hypothetical protein
MYIATQSFKAVNGKTYRMGDIIDSSTYDSLSSKDKAKCKHRKDKDDKSLDHQSPGLGDMLGTGVPGGVDGDFDTPW